MLWLIAGVLVVLWLGGWMLNVVGDVIHVLLVIALVVVALNFVRGFGSRTA